MRIRPSIFVIICILAIIGTISLGFFAGTTIREKMADKPSQVEENSEEEKRNFYHAEDAWGSLTELEFPELYDKTDFESLITIETEEDIIKKRQELIKLIWKQDTLPDGLPEVEEDASFAQFGGAAKVDALRVHMKHGFVSKVYHLHAPEPNGKSVLYHQGHGEGGINAVRMVRPLLSRGYDVFFFSMPIFGDNEIPTVDIDHLGAVEIREHDLLAFLDSDDFSSMSLFVEPVIQTINYIDDEVIMIGFSGGGWTTVLATALDERIVQSYDISGTLPLFLNQPFWGDYEQNNPKVLAIANYGEQYIMAAHNRDHKQILSSHDPYYPGKKMIYYYRPINEKVKEIGGSFEIFIESKPSHELSVQMADFVVDDLTGKIHEDFAPEWER